MLKDHVETCCLLDIEKALLMKESVEIKIYVEMLSNACDTEKRTVERACKLGAYMHQQNG